MEFSEFCQSKLLSPDKILRRGGRKVYSANKFFLVLSYDPWFPIYRLPKLKNLRNFDGSHISRDPRNLKFRRFSISGADISGTRGHMTKPRKTWPQKTLFFHPSEGFCQGMKVWIEKILKIPYPPISGFWNPIVYLEKTYLTAIIDISTTRCPSQRKLY